MTALSTDDVLREAREAKRWHDEAGKPYTAGVFADCIATIERLAGNAPAPREPLQCLRCGTVDAFGSVSKGRTAPAPPHGPETIAVPRWWIQDCRDKMMAIKLESGAAGDFVFLLREIFGDLLNSSAFPSTVSSPQASSPAATTGDTPPGSRPPASAAMGLGAGGEALSRPDRGGPHGA